ncbi:MAG: polyhydroxyalkanoate depolymerase, partial [Pseudomonadota bacterium]|nr:polyhydroxyalkanoate depolymerase [Pseudomonadota bacterium]
MLISQCGDIGGMLYYLYEMQRLWTAPVQLVAEGAKVALNNPFNPWSHTPAGRVASAAVDLVGNYTQRYGKPDWVIEATEIDGKTVPLMIETAIERTYCDLIHFKRQSKRNDPKLLICAPLSGHFATLVRGTIEAM